MFEAGQRLVDLLQVLVDHQRQSAVTLGGGQQDAVGVKRRLAICYDALSDLEESGARIQQRLADGLVKGSNHGLPHLFWAGR
jgi:ABC-type phosphate transport system ATPase subunit